jgi:hypothetical protein
LLCLVTLTVTEKKHAIASSFSFNVDRELIAMLRPNDVLYISRTHCAGLGLSILRDGELVAAAGAVTCVPLGPTVSVRYPHELIEEAEAIFKARDPDYDIQNDPVEPEGRRRCSLRAVTLVTDHINQGRMEVPW